MKHLFLIVVLLIAAPAYAVEQVDLQTPYTVDPRTATTFTVDSLLLNWKDKRIVIHVGNGTIQKMVEYVDLPQRPDPNNPGQTLAADPKATNLMVALNKANLTSNSLHKRILNQLITDGHIAGTISGSVD